jgi:hypothetical protein
MASQKQELLGRYLDRLQGDDVPPEIQGRQAARQILDRAANTKAISRTDLKKAIQLYAGQQATETERVAVGSKMLDFLNKRQVKLVT